MSTEARYAPVPAPHALAPHPEPQRSAAAPAAPHGGSAGPALPHALALADDPCHVYKLHIIQEYCDAGSLADAMSEWAQYVSRVVLQGCWYRRLQSGR